MIRLVLTILAAAVLASMAAAPPRDPCVLLWSIETPLLWTACISDSGKQIIVTSTTTPQADDPIWWDVQAWAIQNEVPNVSPLAGCFIECRTTCAPDGVLRVKFIAAGPNGVPPQSCECECKPKPPTTTPPPGQGSVD